MLTVPTNFGDVAELAAGLVDRVDEERLMLYGPGPFEDGTWVRFSVLLSLTFFQSKTVMSAA